MDNTLQCFVQIDDKSVDEATGKKKPQEVSTMYATVQHSLATSGRSNSFRVNRRQRTHRRRLKLPLPISVLVRARIRRRYECLSGLFVQKTGPFQPSAKKDDDSEPERSVYMPSFPMYSK